MPTIKKIRLEGSAKALNALLKPGTGLPPRAGYWLGRIADVVGPAQEKYNKTRLGLYQRYGTQVVDEEGKPTDFWTVEGLAPERRAEFDAELEALANETVECPHTVRLDAFGDAPVGEWLPLLGDLVVVE